MARPRIKPKIDPKQLVANPFTLSTNFTIRVKSIGTSHEIISKQAIDASTTVTQKSKVSSSFVAEKESFTKLFTKPGNRLHIMMLPPRALSLLLFIAYEIETGIDWLWINKGRYMDESNTSINTYKQAVKDLIRESLITPTVYQDTYWINPSIFFAGNRLKKYPDAIIEEE